MDARSRETPTPSAGKSLARAYRAGASARVGAVRCLWGSRQRRNGDRHLGGIDHTAVGAVWKWSNSAQTMPSLGTIPHGVWLGMSIVELLCVVGLMVPAISKRLAILAPIAAAYVVAEMLLFSGTGPVAVDGADVDDASTQCVIRSNAILTAPHGSLLRGGSTARNRFPSGSQKQNCAGCGSAIATIVDKSPGREVPERPTIGSTLAPAARNAACVASPSAVESHANSVPAS